jgi:hypothetical protein
MSHGSLPRCTSTIHGQIVGIYAGVCFIGGLAATVRSPIFIATEQNTLGRRI